MDIKNKIFGPTLPNELDLANELTKSDDADLLFTPSESMIEQYHIEKAICETIGPLNPDNQLLDEVRHIRPITSTNNEQSKKTENEWMYKMMPPSQQDPLKNLKPRKFLMGANYLSVPEPSRIPIRSDQESLMDIHLKKVNEEKKKVKRKEKKKKHKRERSSSSDSSKNKMHKKKKSKKEKIDVPVKWSPFSAKTTRTPFDRDTELSSKGAMSSKARAAVLKQAHGMYNNFMTELKK